MRNEELLQNCNACTAKHVIKGDLNCYYTSAKTVSEWIRIFEMAIEDLKAGYRINGKADKNTVEYWQKQIKILKEFEHEIVA